MARQLRFRESIRIVRDGPNQRALLNERRRKQEMQERIEKSYAVVCIVTSFAVLSAIMIGVILLIVG